MSLDTRSKRLDSSLKCTEERLASRNYVESVYIEGEHCMIRWRGWNMYQDWIASSLSQLIKFISSGSGL